jgi:hypothetical protein
MGEGMNNLTLNLTSGIYHIPETAVCAPGCKITDLDLIMSYCGNYSLVMPFFAVLLAVLGLLMMDSWKIPPWISQSIRAIALFYNLGLLTYYTYMIFIY